MYRRTVALILIVITQHGNQDSFWVGKVVVSLNCLKSNVPLGSTCTMFFDQLDLVEEMDRSIYQGTFHLNVCVCLKIYLVNQNGGNVTRIFQQI